jgi:GTP-binding protein
MPLVAVVGRPNVGKSTLFNRLTEQRQAIVHDEPGVTRDRIYGDVEWTGRTFDLVDTGGLVPRSEERFEAAIREQVLLTLEEADAILFVLDTKTGITDLDEEIAGRLRQARQPVFVVANKSDNDARRLEAMEFYRLGFEHVFPVSAISGSGTGDLLDAVVESLPPPAPEEADDDAPRLAFIGRPNVGKSSLTNRLLGQNRSIVTEVAGTTRDAVDARLTYDGREVVLVDTAGLRKRARVQENVEFYSLLRTERAIQHCDVAVLLLDATLGLETQDARVLREAEEARKGLVIAVNKWDAVEKETNTARDFTRGLRERLGLLDYVPVEYVSALTGQRAHRVLEAALRVHDERAKKVSTSRLNDVVQAAVAAQHPPTYRGNYVQIKYAAQVHTRPPVFAFFVNHPEGVKESYRRYLENRLREAFGFEGVPLTLSFRKK